MQQQTPEKERTPYWIGTAWAAFITAPVSIIAVIAIGSAVSLYGWSAVLRPIVLFTPLVLAGASCWLILTRKGLPEARRRTGAIGAVLASLVLQILFYLLLGVIWPVAPAAR